MSSVNVDELNQTGPMEPTTYKEAGVDLETYQESMSRLPQLMHRTYSPRVIQADGGFAGLFQIDFTNGLFARSYEDPVLVAGTDGVGTKLKVANLTGKHDTVGIDLVAMCVNDVICCGAEPLFFLDYVAMSHDNPDQLEQIVQGISDGCLQADCALLGGETAIMPDLYSEGDYDLAGFCVGIVERRHMIDGSAVMPGDVVLGIESSGLHSNGYSLVRRVVFELGRLAVEQQVESMEKTVGELLSIPTTIYAKQVRKILNHYKVKNVVHGISHITGGGLAENMERILPNNVNARIERDSWTIPPVFKWIQELGNISDDEMDRVFNQGIGLVLIVSEYYADNIRRMLKQSQLESWQIGTIEEGSGEVVLT